MIGNHELQLTGMALYILLGVCVFVCACVCVCVHTCACVCACVCVCVHTCACVCACVHEMQLAQGNTTATTGGCQSNTQIAAVAQIASNPMSPLTASLEEHPRIRLAPPNIMDSKASTWLLLPSHTSPPYSILGLITESNNSLRVISLLLISNRDITRGLV